MKLITVLLVAFISSSAFAIEGEVMIAQGATVEVKKESRFRRFKNRFQKAAHRVRTTNDLVFFYQNIRNRSRFLGCETASMNVSKCEEVLTDLEKLAQFESELPQGAKIPIVIRDYGNWPTYYEPHYLHAIILKRLNKFEESRSEFALAKRDLQRFNESGKMKDKEYRERSNKIDSYVADLKREESYIRNASIQNTLFVDDGVEIHFSDP